MNTTTFTNISVTLDGIYQESLSQIPGETDQFRYNVSGFVKEGLDNTEHIIVMNNSAVTQDSLILFDYLVYT